MRRHLHVVGFCATVSLVLTTLSCRPAYGVEKASATSERSQPVKQELLSFDVAVIRPSRSDEIPREELLADGFLVQVDSLARLMSMAYYPLLEYRNHPIRNAPDWVRRENLDVLAKVAPEEAAKWERQTTSLELNGPLSLRFNSSTFKRALLKLLVDRCKLQAHTVPMEVDGFALVLEHPGDVRKLALVEDRLIGNSSPQMTDTSGVIITPSGAFDRIDHKPLARLALSLGFANGVTIEDRTGLSGTYSFTVRDLQPIRPTPEERESYTLPSERWDLHPFGLKLVRAKVHTTALVIDHVERPTPN